LPLVALAPWAWQLKRSLDLVHVTKAGGFYLNVAPGTVRDQLVPLVYGENGGRLSSALRVVALLIAVAVIVAGLRLILARARPLGVLLGAALVGTLALHMLAPAAGIGIFNQRYLTMLIPLACVPFAALVSAVRLRWAIPVVAGALVLFGVGLAVKRAREHGDIDVVAIQSAVARLHPGTILTNSAVIDYYLRGRGARLILDRPLGFGQGREESCRACARPLVIVDDASEGGGARPGPGPRVRIGHFVVRLTPSPGQL